MAIVTLTTDFGTQDYYAGAVKGAILRLAPNVRIVDLSHQVPPRDVTAGAFLLRHAATEFPPGSVHLAVVDPGVGGPRRPMVLASQDFIWVGPDNGLFSFALDEPTFAAYEIIFPEAVSGEVSPTFHGRDLFAPTAARLATGLAAEEVGPPISDPVRLPAAHPRLVGGRIEGQVIQVDGFGNLVTNIADSDIEPWGRELCIRLGGRLVRGVATTYSDSDEGEALVLIGSSRLLEIAVNAGSAASVLGVGRGDAVTVERW